MVCSRCIPLGIQPCILQAQSERYRLGSSRKWNKFSGYEFLAIGCCWPNECSR